MKTVADLGRKVKEKYPGDYDDLTDEQVGRLVKGKYPGAYDDYEDTSLQRYTPSPTLPPENPPGFRHLENIYKKYNPDDGMFGHWWDRKKSEGRVKALEVFNQEMQGVIGMEQNKGALGAVLMEQAAGGDRFEEQRIIEQALNENQSRILRAATDMGVDASTYQQLVVQKAMADRELYIAEQMADIEVKKDLRLRLNEQTARSQEIGNDHQKVLNTISAAVLVKYAESLQSQKHIMERIDEVEAEVAALKPKMDDDILVARAIADREKVLVGLRKRLHDEREGLFQGDNRKDTERDDKAPDVSRGLR